MICSAPRLSALVGSRRSLCGGPALSVSGPGARQTSVSGPGAFSSCPVLSASARRSLAALSASVSGPWRSHAVCVGPWRSLCRAPALSVLGPGAPCVGARRFSRCLCWASALSVSSLCGGTLSIALRRSLSLSGALCVRARRSLCGAPTLSASGWARSLFPGENPKPYCLGDYDAKPLPKRGY